MFQAVLASIIAELSGIIVFIAMIAVFRTWWSIFWLFPLFLRLVSAVFSMQREPLASPPAGTINEKSSDFEIKCPQSNGNFLVITGSPNIVLQFARHYGHPVRNRVREWIQLGTIIGFLMNFPLGLLCSMIWMPPPLQWAWNIYQIYTVIAMLFARYLTAYKATTTESSIAKFFGQETSDKERVLLFGQERNSENTIKASLSFTYKPNYGDGKRAVAELLRYSRTKQQPTDEPQPNPPSPESAAKAKE